MVTRKLIRITAPEAAALAAKETSLSSSAAEEDSITVNKQSTTLLTNDFSNEKNGGGKKHALPPGDAVGSKETSSKRQRTEKFVIDLSDVPPQLPIPKSKGYIKEGSSKYAGVTFIKPRNKWQVQIRIDGKTRNIGYYENEEEAAIDYARAVYKYKGEEAPAKARERALARGRDFDLSDVPPQMPILKSEGNIKGGTSKYVGVNFDKVVKKWKAIISIDRKLRHIGYYENEEEAAIHYARAVFKFKGQDALNKARERKSPAISIDLSGVPQQPLILKNEEGVIEGSSKFLGVSFDKSMSKWKAVISIDGMLRHVGWYKNEEEAAADYARAVFKYKGQEALDKARERNKSISDKQSKKRQRADRVVIDLSDVPPQPPIPKSIRRMKKGSSKYVGVTFSKGMNKWQARIGIDGKNRHIGYYDKEEEAAANYARAVFKYKGEEAEALEKAREQKKSTLLANNNNNKNGGGKKHPLPLPSKDMISGKEVKKRQRADSGSSAAPEDSLIINYAPIIHTPEGNNNENSGDTKRALQSPSDGKKRRTVEIIKPAEAAALAAAKSWKPPLKNASTPTYLTKCSNNEVDGEKERAHPPEDRNSGREIKKRLEKVEKFEIDLTDVPPQLPVLKSKEQIKEGSSKYTGVAFDKRNNKWKAQITIDGKHHYIGSYESEGLAAIDYARAVFKYQGQEALVKAREAIDLSDILPQPPIPKSEVYIEEGASKYICVSFDKSMKKWRAMIMIDGKERIIGFYENEGEAIGYARAVFKYKGEETEALGKSWELKTSTLSTNDNNNKNGGGKKLPLPLPSKDVTSGKETTKKRQRADKFVIDLADVPPQLPILKNKGHYKEGTSKYTGVSFHKPRNKWRVSITIEGKNRYVGSYESEEEAAVNYARAVFKYHGQEALDKAREAIDLSDVPPQPPIPKSGRYIIGCSSKYTGVSFDKSISKWRAIIMIDGTKRHIGCYDNEEEAAIDYARAVLKYNKWNQSMQEHFVGQSQNHNSNS